MTNAAYDGIADWYDATIRAGSLVGGQVLPVLFDLITLTGELSGQRVCDLACGQGFLSRELARRGAKVTGLDISPRLIEIARRDEELAPLGLTFVVGDAQNLNTQAEASFEGVICHMALMDIPDLAATFREVKRVLTRPGWFMFSLTHPCFQTPHSHQQEQARVVSGYFEEGFWRSSNPNGVRGQVGAYHRTLSTYLNTLSETGFRLTHLEEPQIPPGASVPTLLVALAFKQ